jgi:phosphoribosylaminoimidazolecarboxamide formyltransferase/IMP cyclohydrolase
MKLRYGLNPEHPAQIGPTTGAGLPLEVVAGEPSYINVLDALGGWALVREASRALSAPVAATFKHVSPAGAATAGELDEVMAATWLPTGVDPSPVATAYIRARDCDPRSSFGDFVAVSEPVDLSLAQVLKGVVSDGIVAPGYKPEALDLLAGKKGGRYVVIEADPAFDPPDAEARELLGVRLEQSGPPAEITTKVVQDGTEAEIPPAGVADLVLAMVTARYTMSNTVTYARDGMVVGIGAGQQSRIDCTRLAGAKVDTWWLRRHRLVRSLPFRDTVRRTERLNWEIRYVEGDMDSTELALFHDALTGPPPVFSAGNQADWVAELDGVALASDGFIPFRDNIDAAARHGVRYVADPGGSTRTGDVAVACEDHGIVLTTTGIRLFRH